MAKTCIRYNNFEHLFDLRPLSQVAYPSERMLCRGRRRITLSSIYSFPHLRTRRPRTHNKVVYMFTTGSLSYMISGLIHRLNV